jgi:Transposase IS66 family
MPLILPDIPEADATPLVRQLLEIIRSQQERLQQLEDEIARLKGQKTRPVIAPSRLETPLSRPPKPGQKRPGSAKRSKNAQLIITDKVVALDNRPPEATFKGYEDFVVQDLVFHAQAIRYRRERWQTAAGRTLVAPLPENVIPGSHFGPDLICFILHQYHHQHVTQPLLLEQLLEVGIDISAGQLSRILTEKKDSFHQEKDQLLPAGLEVSTYVQVDDTGARHQGRNGYCTHIGNDLFATFESTDSKSRLNFLEILRRPHMDYVINDAAAAYYKRQSLAEAVREKLCQGPGEFADQAVWASRLQELEITAERHVRIATEGALLGSLIAHGVPPTLAILSDGAPQFDVLVHASCWIHAERPLARMVPYSNEHRTAIEKARQQIWDLYQDLKTYRQKPEESQKPLLEAAFDALCGERTGFPSIDGVFKEMKDHRADLLRVLERPEIPLHNNLSEGHVRDYVKKRKISGSTRSTSGRRARDTFASLKKTCRRLGVSFWAYLQDRVRGLGQIPPLATLIRQKGEELLASTEAGALTKRAGGGVVV